MNNGFVVVLAYDPKITLFLFYFTDQNECTANSTTYPCDTTRGFCNNSFGSFTCGCNHGYTVNSHNLCLGINRYRINGTFRMSLGNQSISLMVMDDKCREHPHSLVNSIEP